MPWRGGSRLEHTQQRRLRTICELFNSATCALYIAKLSKTSTNGSLLGFSALLVMTFYLVLVTDNVHSTSWPSCSDLLCHIFQYRLINIGRLVLRHLASDRTRIGSPPRQRLPFSNVLAVTPMIACTSVASQKENDAYLRYVYFSRSRPRAPRPRGPPVPAASPPSP